MSRSKKRQHTTSLKPKAWLTACLCLVAIMAAAFVAGELWKDREKSFRSQVVAIHNGSARDGCDSFELENGASVSYFCFWSGERYKGRVIGSIKAGDLVEVKNAHKGPKNQYELYSP